VKVKVVDVVPLPGETDPLQTFQRPPPPGNGHGAAATGWGAQAASNARASAVDPIALRVLRFTPATHTSENEFHRSVHPIGHACPWPIRQGSGMVRSATTTGCLTARAPAPGRGRAGR
jgi:hypothetical protein